MACEPVVAEVCRARAVFPPGERMDRLPDLIVRWPETSAAGPADFGKVMPLVMKEAKGKADGKLVQEMVRRLLGGAQ